MGADLEALLKEVRDIRSSVEKLESIIEQRLLGEEEPLDDEKLAIKEYEEDKAKNRLELVSLEDTMRQLGVQRTGRKKSR
ncbi:MAG: hypothetical protein HYY22_03810 [Thaumarchaeota archaeon]|nr:hypothetical protein [Nitrososphaerota archaeon]